MNFPYFNQLRASVSLYENTFQYFEAEKHWKEIVYVNPFHATSLILYPLKLSGNLWFYTAATIGIHRKTPASEYLF